MLRKRTIEKKLKDLAQQYPVVTVTGPRQSGKTTLCKKLFPKFHYANLENLDERRRAIEDPKSFLESCGHTAVIDEIQRAPDLLSYIQTRVDQTNASGQYILTGSAQFELMEKINQSLAGRTAIIKLLPFSVEEAYPDDLVPTLSKTLHRGFFPRVFDKQLDAMEAASFYVSTYIERDIRTLLNVRDLTKFEAFVKLCASRSGQLANYSSLGNDLGIQHNTAREWMSILETSYVTYSLKPHHQNFGKRLVKSPKNYLLDTSLMCFLLEISDPTQLENHPLKGAIFETFVISELLKQRYHHVKTSNLYFWRDNNGNEVDLLLDFGTVILPIEIKYGKTVSNDYFKGLNYYKKINPNCQKAIVIYGGNDSYRENDFFVISYKDIALLSQLDHSINISLYRV